MPRRLAAGHCVRHDVGHLAWLMLSAKCGCRTSPTLLRRSAIVATSTMRTRSRGKEDKVGGDDIGLGRGDAIMDPPHGAPRAVPMALPRVDPMQEVRVVHGHVPREAQQPCQHQHQCHEDDERRNMDMMNDVRSIDMITPPSKMSQTPSQATLTQVSPTPYCLQTRISTDCLKYGSTTYGQKKLLFTLIMKL
jgi:hypothetical protein